MRTLAIVIVAIIVVVIVGLGTLLGSSWLLIGIAFVMGLCVGLDWGRHDAEMRWLDREASLLRQLSERELLEPTSEPEYPADDLPPILSAARTASACATPQRPSSRANDLRAAYGEKPGE